MIGLGRVNQLVTRGIAYIDEERNPSQAINELREHAKSSLHVRMVRGTDGVEEPVKIDLAILVVNDIVAEINPFGYW